MRASRTRWSRFSSSPKFLYRVGDPQVTTARLLAQATVKVSTAPAAAYRISDLELASRLSFFLWSEGPDEELLESGRQRTQLHEPAVLEAQVQAHAGRSARQCRWSRTSRSSG